MKTSSEQCLELHRRLGDQINDADALNRDLRRMGAEQRLAPTFPAPCSGAGMQRRGIRNWSVNDERGTD